ncbi:molecular chaperone TorD family protein [Providencia heimbachae]|uniref:Putative anaerobic dehydrogenase oxidoreductase component n=1 Tax=Providencia heimbachae ATCC 35613 TaxID=1354272 RepID=A0A1B7JRC0_9GAMM|nr:molecular chaperone TorD family protein [Providencia heimbachae]MDD9339322.1 molecular chaperone TorD family protein [Providencia heimbachae]OAT50458.1 putative anaerobic dehydrogenase oxidoreductase component [Providencia heimbachae ATCC 35613]QCJ68814.1 DmsD [Providencia heimbachae]SQH11846.1 Twin-arginine leader-binding protein DmsD [Providencia heimbachae]
MIHFSHYAAAFNVLGTCYLFSPKDETSHYAVNFFKTEGFATQWPCKIDKQLSQKMTQALNIDLSALDKQWSDLFIGPQALPAPPWGSVYLDPEGVLQGSSTIALSQFLKRERLKVQTPYPEPSDHVGLMLFQAAVLASQVRESALNELLVEHLGSWLPQFSHQLNRTTPSPFYEALTELTLITVNACHPHHSKINHNE